MNSHSGVGAFSIDSLPSERRERLMEILETYLMAREEGFLPDADGLAADDPELAGPLKAYLASLDFLHQAAAAFSPPRPTDLATPAFSNKRLGDYAIVREIGRGGMGIVYEAKQISLDRLVALKVLPFAAVLDQKQITRFGNEARAAAQLHHPHIVPVYAVGCERGVHYYAMQYVNGQTIAQLIDQLRRPSDPEAAGHRPQTAAHPARGSTSGQLDRTAEWPSPEPPIPDAAGPTKRLTGSSAETRPEPRVAVSTEGGIRSPAFFRSVAGLGLQAAEALEYAHQLGVVHRDIKPANLLVEADGHLWITDFGLAMTQTGANLTMTGDVLGTLRYMSPEQVAAGRRVLDHRTDIYSLGVTLYELLTTRPAFAGEDRQRLLRKIVDEDPPRPRRLNQAIPKDLETIVLKAINKEPAGRYPTAQELADDLRRFLEGKPTLARRPTVADRALKWARRHKAAVWSGVGLTLIGLAGLVASTLLIAQAHSRTKAALAKAEAGFRQAEENSERAEDHFRQARRVVDRFAARHAERLANVPGAEPLRRELLNDALRYYQQFIEQAGDDPALRTDLALTHFKVGQITERIGDRQQALAAYRRAKQRFEELAKDQPGRREHRRHLALCHNNMGLLLSQAGSTAAAEKAHQEAIDVQSRLVGENPDSAELRSDLALSYGNLGLLQSQTDRLDEAEESYRAALEIQQELVRRHPDQPKYGRNLAVSHNNLGFLYAKSDPVKAERAYREALSIQKKLVDSHPDDTTSQSDLALTYNNLGALHSHHGRLDEAKAAYQKAIAIQEELLAKAPLVTPFRRDLAISHNNLGRLYSRAQQPAGAYQRFDQARAVLEDLVRDYPNELSYRSSLGGILNNQGMVLEQLDRPEEAVLVYRRAIEHQQFALARAPSVARFREFLSKHYGNLGRALREAGRPGEAAEAALARKELWHDNPQQLYGVAGELALAAGEVGAGKGDLSAEEAAARQQYADDAVATLREAIEAGLTPPDSIHKDPDFDGIRGQPAFRELLKRHTERQGG